MRICRVIWTDHLFRSVGGSKGDLVGKSIRIFVAMGTLLLLPGLLAACNGSGDPSSDPTIAYPNLRVEVPTNDISISSPSPSTRTLDFTHITWNAGAGPLEIRPQYNPSTGTAQATQALYTLTGTSTWSFVKTVPIARTMTWEPPSDYRFPLTSFGLYSVGSGGGIGSLVASSPKVDFCITPDTYVGGVPNTTANPSPPQSDCTNPNGVLGLSVGWGDEYDYTDPGNNIDISNLPDGTYWLRAQADPGNYLQQSGPNDTITDTELTISGTTVSVLKQVNPQITPPVVTMTSPAAGSTVSGSVTLQATVTDSSPIQSVQFLLDGEPIGPPQTAAPYSLTVGSLPAGSQNLSAQATDSNGIVGTAPVITVNVATQIGALTIDQQLNATGNGSITTPSFSTAGNEVLLALVGSDGPSAAGSQSVTVSGAGLTWSPVKRANSRFGDAEIWSATTSSPLSNVTVTSTESRSGYDQSLTVVSIQGASGTGASAAGGAASGAPTVRLTTQGKGSVSFAVGNDYDNAIARTLGGGQTMISQWLDSRTGDTYWSQYVNTPSTSVGQTVTLNDTAPTTDQWNMAAVEVLPSASSTPPPPSPPMVAISAPSAGQTVSGTIQVSANATASGGATISSVQVLLDGQPLGPALTSAPYTVSWNTTTALDGSHTLSAVATDSNGNQGTASPIEVSVANASVCFTVDVNVTAHGRGPVTTSAFHTGSSAELLLALVGSDGPLSGGQSVTVSGAGLTWKLVQRANESAGDAEIWEATASSVLSNATVTATQSIKGYDEFLNVVSIQGTAGTGAAAGASAQSGAPQVTLTTTQPQSLVFGVGNDYDNAISRTVGPNQVILSQWLDTSTGDTYWSQNTSTQAGPAGTSVTLNDTAPTTDRWNLAAVEVIPATDAAYTSS
jgi:hypothetical protein